MSKKVEPTNPIFRTGDRGPRHEVSDSETQHRLADLTDFRQRNSGVMAGWRVQVGNRVTMGTVRMFDNKGFVKVEFTGGDVENIEPSAITRTYPKQEG
ncbi:MAG: hypothetical protein Q8P90_04535 [bacterium]|nr:hypothetical protein [bacterium]